MPASIPINNDGGVALENVPILISARSANNIISEDRPTRIQAETLLVLNGLLDELLLLIISSAKSLATNRIKTDGMLRAFGNNPLAKDAVLEAELELRSYVEGRRAEGAKVPLGLMATSRLDGTDGFPVQSAYKALRNCCQYYSTLSDSTDDGAPKDQNIMSSDGRPIATVTPGAAIYVTALLEFVGQHILQNVSRVIERDNSDEASLYDLRAAITEDEHLNSLFVKMSIRTELARRIEVLESRRRKITEDGAGRGLRSDARVVKPWHIPTAGDFDEAAGPTLFSSKRASLQAQPRSEATFSSASSSSRHGHTASNSIAHSDSLHGSMSTTHTSSLVVNNDSNNRNFDATYGTSQGNDGFDKHKLLRRSTGLGQAGGGRDGGAGTTGSAGRRQSSERTWSGMFGTMKRRSSFKRGSEAITTSDRPIFQTDTSSSVHSGSAMDPDDDFEALMLSGQTMKVSLTPNRLHTIEVAEKGQGANAESVRARPGTLGQREDSASAAAVLNRGLAASDALAAAARHSTSSTTRSDSGNVQSTSRSSLQTTRQERRLPAPPPSSYRSPSPALIGQHNLLSREVVEEDATPTVQPLSPPLGPRRSALRLQPRDDDAEGRTSTSKDLVDLFKSTPPSATSERFGNIGSETSSLTDVSTKKSAMSDRVRVLFGRKSTSSTGHAAPASPRQRSFLSHQRTDTKASLDDSQDTNVTSSTNNSLDPRRSVVTPTSAPSERHVAPRSSTSTSEHPSLMSDTAVEAKPAANVAVIDEEQTPSKATIGLGVGVAATAGAAAITGVARDASHGSRSTSYASQTPSSTEGALQEEASADDSSTASKSKATEELVSRKVPWGYKRGSASTSTMIDRNGTPISDRRRSAGYQSSNGHGVLPIRGVASSENGHSLQAGVLASPTVASAHAHEGAVSATSASSIARGNSAPTAWSGSGSQTLSRRGSFGARPSSMIQTRRSSMNLETIQLLADLERAMRTCHSVDECRALVQKAMHSDGAPPPTSTSQSNGVVDEHGAYYEDKAESTSSSAIAGVVAGAGVAGAATTAGLLATTAQNGTAPADSEASKCLEANQHDFTNGSNVHDVKPDTKAVAVETAIQDKPTSLEQVDQGLIVAWLLGGDEGPSTTRDASSGKLSFEQQQHDKQKDAGSAVAGAVPAADRPDSIDSLASRSDTRGRASSNAASVQSNYKDAPEEVGVE